MENLHGIFSHFIDGILVAMRKGYGSEIVNPSINSIYGIYRLSTKSSQSSLRGGKKHLQYVLCTQEDPDSIP